MVDTDLQDCDAIAVRLRQQTEADRIRVTVHAHQEMVEEGISLDDVRDVLLDPMVIENYPEHKRGPCCLVCQRTAPGRYVHAVCTTALDLAIIITVYEPRPPKWRTPFERGTRA